VALPIQDISQDMMGNISNFITNIGKSGYLYQVHWNKGRFVGDLNPHRGERI
jgi:hypothetical protein